MCGGGDGGDGSGQCSNTHVGNVKLLFLNEMSKNFCSDYRLYCGLGESFNGKSCIRVCGW